jgi:hypothetical protein
MLDDASSDAAAFGNRLAVVSTTRGTVSVATSCQTASPPTQVGRAPRLMATSSTGSAWAALTAASSDGRPCRAWWSSAVIRATLAVAKARPYQ